MTTYKGFTVPAGTDPANVPLAFRNYADSVGTTYASTAAADAAAVPSGYVVLIAGVPMYRLSSVWYRVAVQSTPVSYTPTLTQNASVAKTTTEGRWIQTGTVIEAWVTLAITGAGNAGTQIEVGLPVAASGHAAGTVLGNGAFRKTGTNLWYSLAAQYETATTVNFTANSNGAFGTATGGGVTLANGDILRMHVRYTV